VQYLHCKCLGRESFNSGRGGPLHALKAYSEWWGSAPHALNVSTKCVSFTARSQVCISAVSALYCCLFPFWKRSFKGLPVRKTSVNTLLTQSHALWCHRSRSRWFLSTLKQTPLLVGISHSNMLGTFRKDWETGTHSTQCLFWHFIVTYLCLCICICRHIVPLSQHFRPPRYWDSWCSASTWGGTTQIVVWLWMNVPKLHHA
jgi:hypothetical protein